MRLQHHAWVLSPGPTWRRVASGLGLQQVVASVVGLGLPEGTPVRFCLGALMLHQVLL